MCVVLLTTAHPSYPLILIDNRDEFILRPTSRPHWWTHPETGTKILSSRDLQRAEKGTWLGITDRGVFAVLTNYRETDINASHPIHAKRSRGGMVTAWLGSDADEETADTVHHLVKDSGVKGVGGFSMIAGKLRKKRRRYGEEPGTNGVSATKDALKPTAIVSNRCHHVHDVPWIAEPRGEVYGLSNTTFDNPEVWPKVAGGKQQLKDAIELAVSEGINDEQLVERLFGILDTDTLPPPSESASFVDQISKLKQSIFIPPIGDDAHRKAMEQASYLPGKGQWDTVDRKAAEELERPDAPDAQSQQGVGFETGMYGTQRQTVVLVDWDGNVSFRERALWDSNGNPVDRGEGDVLFRFKIEGWED